jgi:glycosyltransferase involved in cell wall biosynthesis
MRIGVDGYNLALPRGTGIATYARTLTHAIKSMGHQVDVIYGIDMAPRASADMREIIFFDSLDNEHRRKPAFPLSARWWRGRRAALAGDTAMHIPLTGRVESRGFADRMPAYDRILNVPALFHKAGRHFRATGRLLTIRVAQPPDIMHWTYPLPIRLIGSRNIYTIHDLVPLRLPFATLDDKGVHYRLIRTLIRAADMICTVSEASRRDITAFFPAGEAKIINTYQSLKVGSAQPVENQADITAALAGRFDLAPDGYFIFCGSLEPKKNIINAIEAYLASSARRPLLIVGAMSWQADAVTRTLKRAQATGRVRYLDYLPAATLALLIRHARALLFPSLTEGFGLPVLEALAVGTPVITSREGALPEIAGAAAAYVDAYDIADITAGIARLDNDDQACQALRDAGPAQAAKFSSPAYQARLRTLYETVLTKVLAA